MCELRKMTGLFPIRYSYYLYPPMNIAWEIKNNSTMRHGMYLVLLILLFASAFPTNLSAQTKKEAKKAIKDRDENFFSGSIAQSDFNETVHFQNVSGLMVISVTINGKVYDFIFDTGAPTIVSDELAQALHLEKTGTSTMNDGTKTTRKGETYMIKELKIGKITFNNTGCTANKMDDLGKVMCKKIDGIIGVNLMHECYWKIKFDDSTIHFSDKLPAIPPTAAAMDFVEDFGKSPYMQMQYEDSTMYIEFDCGSNGGLDISENISAINLKKQKHSFSSGYGITGQTFYQKLVAKKYIGIADSIKIGGVQFRNKLVFLSKERNRSLMGTSFMKNYETTIDWNKRKIYLNQLSDTLDTKKSRSFGVNLLADSGKLKVIFLWEGSQAADYGIKIGDIVTSVNDINTAHITNEQYCDQVSDYYTKETLKLSIKDAADNEKTYTLHKYDLVK